MEDRGIFTGNLVIEKGRLLGIEFNIFDITISGKLTEEGYKLYKQIYPDRGILDAGYIHHDGTFHMRFLDFIAFFSNFNLRNILEDSCLFLGGTN